MNSPGLAISEPTALRAATPPEWLILAPAGTTVGRDGRSFSNPDPARVVARFLAGAVDIPVDWEHATHIRGPQGLDAPAAGWVVELQSRDGALWGRVSWTADGAEAIRSRAYRYYSPAYYLQGDAVEAVASVGLTGQPNLSLPALHREAAERAQDAARIALAFGHAPQPRHRPGPRLSAHNSLGALDVVSLCALIFGN